MNSEINIIHDSQENIPRFEQSFQQISIEQKIVKFIWSCFTNLGYALKINDEFLSIDELMKHYSRLFYANNGEEIYLTVVDADNNDGWITLQPHSSHYVNMIVTGCSSNLEFPLNLIQTLFTSNHLLNWRDANHSLPRKESIYMECSKWCLVLTKKGNIKKSFFIQGKYWDDVQADDKVTHWIYLEELPLPLSNVDYDQGFG
ncbi:hypothetical protein [Gilliamella sp. BG7]|uniref:hypothetical protein n=1 Tax=unclassified Gilliamella TaxID=2685620 RepID=UPI0039875312